MNLEQHELETDREIQQMQVTTFNAFLFDALMAIPNVFKFFMKRALLILFLMTIGYIYGCEEARNMFIDHEIRDMGSLISIFGIFYTVSSFFSINNKLSVWLSNMGIGILLITFGLSMHSYGLIYAFIISGAFLVIMGYFISAFNPAIFSIITWIVLPIILILFPFRNSTNPTEIPPQLYKPIDIITLWDIEVLENDCEKIMTLPLKTKDQYIEIHKAYGSSTIYRIPDSAYNTPCKMGTQMSKISECKNFLKEFQNLNPNKKFSIRIKCQDIPKKYALQYGEPYILYHWLYIYTDKPEKQSKPSNNYEY